MIESWGSAASALKGKQSGAVTEMPFGTITDMKNGRAIRIWTYLDPQEALEAAGLSE